MRVTEHIGDGRWRISEDDNILYVDEKNQSCTCKSTECDHVASVFSLIKRYKYGSNR